MSSHPPIVVVDTTAFRSDLVLSGSAWQRTKLLALKGRLQLWVPEVVVREATRHYRTQLKLHLGKITSARDAMAKLNWDRRPQPGIQDWKVHVEALENDYQQWLRNWLQHAGATILALPRMSHEAMLDRALREDKPFRAKGDKDKSGPDGYRDMLIWASVAERSRDHLSGEDTLILVTNNSSDFCDLRDKTRTAPVLQADLGDAGPAVHWLSQLDQLDALLPAKPEEARELEVQRFLMTTGNQYRSEVLHAIDTEIEFITDHEISQSNRFDGYGGNGLDFDALHLPLDSPRLVDLDVDHDTLRVEVYGTDPDSNETLARISVQATAYLAGYLLDSEYDESLGFSGRLVNDHVYHSEGDRLVDLQFNARIPNEMRQDIFVDFEKAVPATIVSRITPVIADPWA